MILYKHHHRLSGSFIGIAACLAAFLLFAYGCGLSVTVATLKNMLEKDHNGKEPTAPIIILNSNLSGTTLRGDVLIKFGIRDSDGSLCNVSAYYALEGAGSVSCTPQSKFINLSQTRNLVPGTSSPAPYTFLWDSQYDLGNTAYEHVTLILEVTDGVRMGSVNATDITIINTNSPIASLTTPASGVGGNVSVFYTLSDLESDTARVEAFFSLDCGASWTPCTEAAGLGDGTQNLATSPAGVTHTFVWNSTADVSPSRHDVIVAVVPYDSQKGTEGRTGIFVLNDNEPPSVSIEVLADVGIGNASASQPVVIPYVIADSASDPADVVVEYSLENALFLPCTEYAPASDGTASLQTQPGGSPHVFAWDAVNDIPSLLTNAYVIIRITPFEHLDNTAVGAAATSNQFFVDKTFVAHAPVVIITPLVGLHKGDIPVEYRLIDQGPLSCCSITVEYKLDGETDFTAAAAAPGMGNGTDNLPASAAGVNLTFYWRSTDDLPSNAKDNVVLRIIPHDEALFTGAAAVTPRFSVNNNNAPRATNIVPTAAGVPGRWSMGYSLIDEDSDVCTITVEYSINNGSTFSRATETTGMGGEGTANLASAPDPGIPHTFLWDSVADLGHTVYSYVMVRITPADIRLGTPGYSAFFTVNNNEEPSVILETPDNGNGGPIAIIYTLYDSASDPVDITVEYAIAAPIETWIPATQAATPLSEGWTNLSSSPAGVEHRFFWNSLADLGAVRADVKIRITPTDRWNLQGVAKRTNPFTVDNTPSANHPPTAVVSVPGTILSGNTDVIYSLIDQEGNPCSIAAEYTTDGGAIWRPCSRADVPYSEGTTDLASAPLIGKAHIFVWDSVKDVGMSNYPAVKVRIRPSDAKPGTTGVSKSFAVYNNSAPILQASAFLPGEYKGSIAVKYLLQDAQQDNASIKVEYSAGAGAPWYIATEVLGCASSEGTANIASGPLGSPLLHTFVWDSARDLRELYLPAAYIRITPRDSVSGNPSNASLTVDNNTPPGAYVYTPSSTVKGTYPVTYQLFDPTFDPARITAEYYQEPSGPWKTATPDLGNSSHHGVTNLTTGPSGAQHVFTWISGADLPGVRNVSVRFRVTPTDMIDNDSGAQAITSSFKVTNNAPPVVQINPLSGAQTGNVSITYQLFDSESDNCSILLEYKIPSGDWKNATMAFGEGLAGLSANSTGVPHLFAWNTLADLGEDYLQNVSVRIRPSDGAAGAECSTVISLINNNAPPTVAIASLSGTLSGAVPVQYRLYDSKSHTAAVSMQYTLDNGAVWLECAEATGGGSEGNANLSTSPSGVQHLFVWNSVADIPVNAASVRIRITPSDYSAGLPVQSGIFTVLNMGLSGNVLPSVIIAAPSSLSGQNVSISITLFDANCDNINLLIQYSIDSGGSWFNATEAAGPPSEGTYNLSSSFAGSVHVFVWNTFADIGNSSYTTVRLRVTPYDPYGAGTPAETPDFAVDNKPPWVVSAILAVSVDPTGKTLDITFSEPVDPATAQSVYTYSVDGVNPASAVLQNATTVRLTFSTPLSPGFDLLSVMGIKDLAGNRRDLIPNVAISSQDSTPPAILSTQALAISGLSNDRLTVTFTEPVVASDALNPANYVLENPTGTPVTLAGSNLTYDNATNTVTINLPFDIPANSSYTLRVNDVRDISGNPISPGASASGLVIGDLTPPSLISAVQDLNLDPSGKTMVLTFSEALDFATASAKENYTLSGGQSVTAVQVSGNGTVVTLTLSDPVLPGTNTLGLQGIKDAAGNVIASATGIAISSTHSTPPAIASASATAVTGPFNDVITVTFSEQVHEQDALDIAHYALLHPGSAPVDISAAAVQYNSSVYTATITLSQTGAGAVNLRYGQTFTIIASNIRDIAGNLLASENRSDTVGGDGTPPAITASAQNLDLDPSGKTIDIVFDEPLLQAEAENAGNYLPSGGTATVSATLLENLSAVRIVLSNQPVPGLTNISVSGVRDLAYNLMSAIVVQISSRAPEQPVSPAASGVSGNSITWTWTDNSTFETSYEILDENGTVIAVLPPDCTSYMETGLAENTEYTRMVRAVCGSYAGAASAPMSARTCAEPPTDADISASAGTDNITITVTPPEDFDCGLTAAYFACTQGGAPDCGWNASYSYTPTGLSPNTTYAFLVKLRNADGVETSYNPNPIVVVTSAAVPENVSAGTVTDNSIAVQWDAAGNPGWTTYVVERSDSPSGPFSTVYTGTATGFTDNGLSAAATYYYRVKAVGVDGTSTAYTTLTPIVTAPPAPVTFLPAEAGDSFVRWYWTDTGGETGYAIENSSGGVIATLPADCTSYTETGLAGNTEYVRRVQPLGVASGEPSNLGAIWTRASDPDNASFVLTVDSPTQVTLSIAAPPNNSSGSSGARFDRVQPSGPGADSSGWLSGAYSYAATNLTPNTTYTWIVYERNAAGVPTASAGPKSVVTLAETPPSISISGVLTSSAALSWNTGANPADTVFEIERRTEIGNFSNIFSGTASTYIDSGLADGATYCYRIRAVNREGAQSPYSSEFAMRTSGLFTPGGLTVISRTASSITWGWTDNSSTETGFELVNHSTGAVITSVGAGVTSVEETSLNANTLYVRHVRAAEGGARSGDSVPLGAYTLANTPADGDLTVTVRGATRISFSATAPQNPTLGLTAARFECLECSAASSGWEQDYSYTNSFLAPNTTYTWQVRYRNAEGVEGNANATPISVCTHAAAPTAPQYANVSYATLDVLWNANGNPSGTAYELERKKFGDVSFVQIYTGSANSFSDSGLSGNSTYYYRVRAFNWQGLNSAYVESSIYTAPNMPDAPANPNPADLAANVSINAPLDWDNAPRADGYYVFFGTAADPPYNASVTDSTWNPGTLDYYTTYFWKIIAYNVSGNSSTTIWSFRSIIQTPDAAVNPSPADCAANVAINTVLDWDNSARAAGYYVFFGTAANPPYNASVTDSTWNPGTLGYDTTYYWKTISYNAGGNASATIWSFRTIIEAPAQAANPSPADCAVDVSTSTLLNWDDSARAVGYYLFFGTDSDPPYNSSVISSGFDPGILAVDTTYYWKVIAYNVGGNASTTIWSFKTVPLPPDAVANPTPADTAANMAVSMNLDWDNSARATGYYVFLGTNSDPPYYATAADSICPAGGLQYDTSYYWKVIAYNPGGNSSAVVWSFKTSSGPMLASLAGYYDTHSAPGPTFENEACSANNTVHFTWDCNSITTGFYWYFGTNPAPAANQFAYTSDKYTESHTASSGVNYFLVKATDGFVNSNAVVYTYFYDDSIPIVLGAHLQNASAHAAGDGISTAGGITADCSSLYGDYDSITEQHPDCTSFILTVTGGAGSNSAWSTQGTIAPAPVNFTGLVLSGAVKLNLKVTHYDRADCSGFNQSADYFVKPFTPLAPVVTQIAGNWSALDVNMAPHASENSLVEYSIYCETNGKYVQSDGSLGDSPAWKNDAAWGTIRVTGLAANTAHVFKTQSRNYYDGSVKSEFSPTGGATTMDELPAQPENPSPPDGAHDVPIGF
jgi:fibronectin type 3 domain-containing protein